MASDSEKRIDRLLTRAERHIAQVFSAAIDTMRDELDLREIADLLENGKWTDALDIIEREAARIGAASNMMFVRAGQDTATFLSRAGVANIAFDQVNVRGVQMMQANRLNLIRQFTDGQRDVLRSVMSDGVARGLNPIEQARQFREVVGLTDRQARSIMNYRRMLERAGVDGALDQAEALTRELRDKRYDRTVRRAIAQQQPLTKAQIDKMVEANRRKTIKMRAEMIARTEALRSVHQGTNEAFDQAIEMGQIKAEQIEQTWRSAQDARVRESHRNLNGEVRPMGGTWPGKYGDLRYPGDPSAPAGDVINCRCIIVRRIKREARG